MENFPIIRLEIGHMRQTVKTALMQYVAQMDSDINRAVDTYLSSDTIQDVITCSVVKEINTVIEDEIKNTFSSYRSGFRNVVRECLRDTLFSGNLEKKTTPENC